jgi:hypothetical protein
LESAPKSLRPSSMSTTASPSIGGSSAGRPRNRLGDCREPIREVGAAAAPDFSALAQLAGKNPEAIVFHLMQPAGSGGRAIGERGLARANEADWRISSPAGR